VSRDGGIETQISSWGGGPGGNEIPIILDYFGVSYKKPLEWSDGSPGPSDSYYAQTEQQTAARYWTIVTTNPRAGTYHLKSNVTNIGDASPSWLHPLGFAKCDPIVDDVHPTWVTAQVLPGNYVSIECYAKLLNPSGASCYVDFSWYYLDSAGEIKASSSTVNNSQAGSNVYSIQQHSFFVPSTVGSPSVTPKYLFMAITVGSLQGVSAGETRDIYIDDIKVDVT
jgi:hypothetical protein